MNSLRSILVGASSGVGLGPGAGSRVGLLMANLL